jgi:hypothetical protein
VSKLGALVTKIELAAPNKGARNIGLRPFERCGTPQIMLHIHNLRQNVC